MKTILTLCLCALSSSPLLADEGDEGPIAIVSLDRQEPVSFDKEIKPIFVSKCYVCHSGNVTAGELDLSSHQLLIKGGANGPPVRIGKSADSLLVKLAGRTDDPLMPPPREKDTHPLTPTELALIKLWIDQGAKPPAAIPAGAVIKRLAPSVRIVRAVAIAPDKSLVIAGNANQIHLYHAATGDYLRTLADPRLAAADGQPVQGAHLSIVESLAVSPDSRLLASGSFGDVALWDIETGQLLVRLEGFAHRVVALDFSPDGRYLAAGGGAPTVAGEIKVFAIAIEPDSPAFGAADASRRPSATVTPMLELPAAHSDTVFGIRFSPDGGRLATCGADMSINVFAFPSGKLLKQLEGHTHHVLDVAWQADGALLASAGADKRVRLWVYDTGEQLTRINRGGGAISTVFLDHQKQVNRLMFVGDTTQILTCSGDQPTQLWRLTKQMRPGNYAKPYIRGSSVRAFGDGTDYIYAAAASLDGALIATGGRNGVVGLYQGADGKLIGELSPPDDAARQKPVAPPEVAGTILPLPQPSAVLAGHEGFVNAVAYSPDGKLLASASSDHTVGLWDVTSGKKSGALTGHSGYVRCLAFSTDGAMLASAGADQKIKLWSVASRQERATLWGHIGEIHDLTFAADGTLYSASRDGTIKAWDIATEQKPQILAEQASPVRRVVLSPDQKTVASAGGDGTITLWDVEFSAANQQTPPAAQEQVARTPRAKLAGHTGAVMSINFSADGTKLVSAGADKTIRLWDLAAAQELRTIEGHSGVVYSAAFSPDGTRVASAGGDQLIKLWDVDSGEEKGNFKGHTGEVYFVTFSPDGKTLASASHDISVKLWDPQSGKVQKTLKGHQGYIRALAFSADGKSLATASADRTVKLWDAQSGKVGKTLSGHTGIVLDVAFSVDGKTLVSACGDESIKLWDVEQGTERATLNGHHGDIFSVLISDDGRYVVSAGEDGTIRRWSSAAGKPPRTLAGHRDAVYSVAVSPDGKTLASCSYDGTIKLWDTQTDKQLATMSGHTHLIRAVAFSPDGKTLASASHDGTARLWDVESRKERVTLAGHENLVVAVAFSPDGKSLASTSVDQTVRLWNVETGEPQATWKVHAGHLRCLALSPDGLTIASGSDDRTIKMWKLDAAN